MNRRNSQYPRPALEATRNVPSHIRSENHIQSRGQLHDAAPSYSEINWFRQEATWTWTNSMYDNRQGFCVDRSLNPQETTVHSWTLPRGYVGLSRSLLLHLCFLGDFS